MSGDKDNHHPLTADFSMYYTGTYVFANIDGEPRCMYVQETDRNGDDTKLAGVNLLGTVYTVNDCLGSGVWSADRMDHMRPFSGYFDLGNPQKEYVSWVVRNRSNKKGFSPNDINHPGGISGQQVTMLYAQSRDLHCCPGRRDIYIHDGKLNWKGMEVGTYVDGKFTPHQPFIECEAMVCRLLQHI